MLLPSTDPKKEISLREDNVNVGFSDSTVYDRSIEFIFPKKSYKPITLYNH
jgi:hypothetical protein